jgi:hypothetical protein
MGPPGAGEGVIRIRRRTSGNRQSPQAVKRTRVDGSGVGEAATASVATVPATSEAGAELMAIVAPSSEKVADGKGGRGGFAFIADFQT